MVLGVFVVFGWDPVEISLSIRFEGKSRVSEDENNTIEQPDACSMDAISRKDFAWVWVVVLGVFVVFGWDPVEISLSIRFEGKSRVYEDENNTIEQPDACSMDAISRKDFAWVWVVVLGVFVVFGWDPVEISLSIRFEGKSRVYEDENNTIEQPDACSMDAISRKDFAWVWVVVLGVFVVFGWDPVEISLSIRFEGKSRVSEDENNTIEQPDACSMDAISRKDFAWVWVVVLGVFVVFGWDPVEISLSIRFEGKSRVSEDENNTIEQPDACSMDAISRKDFAWVWVVVLGVFVVFGWDPVEISLSIRFEGKSRVSEDENNTIEQPDACSMDAISRKDFAWVWVMVLGVFVVFGWDPVEISLSIRFEGKSRVYEDENNTIEQPDACSMDAISRKDFAWVWVVVLGVFVVFGWDPVEISLSIRFEGKSRVSEDENNTIEQPDACSMDAISRKDFAWVWVVVLGVFVVFGWDPVEISLSIRFEGKSRVYEDENNTNRTAGCMLHGRDFT